MSDDIVENLKQPSQWFRVAFMVALAVILYVVGLALTLLTVAQILFSLLTGQDNENLRQLGKGLSTYVQQILEFLTYNTEQKPFPFAPYPQPESAETVFADAETTGASGADSSDVVTKPVRVQRKRTVKKNTPPDSAADGEV